MRRLLDSVILPFGAERRPTVRYRRDRVRKRPSLERLELRSLLSLTTVGFDNLPENTLVNKSYDSSGVDFTGATVITKGSRLSALFPPHSGNSVVDDRTGPITATAAAGTDWTEVGGYITGNHKIVMEAFEADGTMVGKVSTQGANYIGAGTGLSPNFKLDIKGSDIAYVEFIGNADGGADFTLDDFFFQSKTTILPSSLNWNVTNGGVDFTYSSADPLPFSVPVDFYWSPTTTFDATEDTAAYVTFLEEGQSPSPIHVNPSSLTAPPPGTMYLLAVLDPTQTVLLKSAKDTLPLPYDPTMTVTSKYNGNSDPSTFGRFLAIPGAITNETLTIQLSDSLAALRPDVSTWVGDQALLSTHHVTTGILGSWDGLTYETDPFDPGSLSESTTLSTQAFLGNGTNLLQVTDTLEVEQLPTWLTALSDSSFTFAQIPGSSGGNYVLKGSVVTLTLPPSASTIPVTVPLIGGDSVQGKVAFGITATVPLDVSLAPTVSGYTNITLGALGLSFINTTIDLSANGGISTGFQVTPEFTLDSETLQANGDFGLLFSYNHSGTLLNTTFLTKPYPVKTFLINLGLSANISYNTGVQASVSIDSAGKFSLTSNTSFDFGVTANLTGTAGVRWSLPATALPAFIRFMHNTFPGIFTSSTVLPSLNWMNSVVGTLSVESQVSYVGETQSVVPVTIGFGGSINFQLPTELVFSVGTNNLLNTDPFDLIHYFFPGLPATFGNLP